MPRKYVVAALFLLPLAVWGLKVTHVFENGHQTSLYNERALINNAVVDGVEEAVGMVVGQHEMFRKAVSEGESDSNKRGAVALIELVGFDYASKADDVKASLSTVDSTDNPALAALLNEANILLDLHADLSDKHQTLYNMLTSGEYPEHEMRDILEFELTAIEVVADQQIDLFEAARQAYMQAE